MGVYKQDNCKNLVIKDCKIFYPNHNRVVEVLDDPSTSNVNDRIHLVSESYPYIDGNNALIENCEVGWAENKGLLVNGKANTIKNCVVHNTALNGIMKESGIELAFGFGQVYDISGSNKLENCTIYNSGGIAVYHRGPGPQEVNYNHIFNSGIYSGDISAYYLPYAKKAQGSVLSYNWVHGTHGKALRVDSWGDSIYVHHNVSWNNTEGGKWQGPGPWYIFNNTIFDQVASMTMTIWKQEINYNSQLSIEEYGVDFVDGVSYHNRFLENSDVMNNLTYWLYYRGNTVGDHIYDFHENEHFTSNDEIGNQASQFFVSTSSGTLDLRPKAGSPAIDAGVVIPGFTDYVTDGIPDIGAYEFGGEYWYPGADWMNDGMVVPTTMSGANQLASTLRSNPTGGGSGSRLTGFPEEGLEQTAFDKVQVYPNPTSGTVNIQLPEDLQIHTLELIDVMGRVVLVERGLSDATTLKLDLSLVNEGLYFIKAYSSLGAKSTHRLLIVNG